MVSTYKVNFLGVIHIKTQIQSALQFWFVMFKMCVSGFQWCIYNSEESMLSTYLAQCPVC